MLIGERRQGAGDDQFHRPGRDEGDAQHAHGALAQLLRRGAEPRRLGLLLVEQHQHRQAAHAVEEAAGQALQGGELAAARLRRADAGQRLDDRHHEPGAEQDQPAHRIRQAAAVATSSGARMASSAAGSQRAK